MSDIEKTARRMIQQAAKDARNRSEFRGRRVKPKVEQPETEELFCATCYAEMDEGTCPRCTRANANAPGFCRSCLYVHAPSERCSPWRPSTPSPE